MSAPFDLAAFRYYIGNPSAWDHYDEGVSERMRAAADAIERLQSENKHLNGLLEVVAGRMEEDQHHGMKAVSLLPELLMIRNMMLGKGGA